MATPVPSIPSHDKWVDFKGHVPPSVPSHEQYVDYVADKHSYLGANSTDDTNPIVMYRREFITAVADAVARYKPEEKGIIVMSYVLIAIFFAFFLAIIFIDMRAKHRSGELRDDMRSAKKMVVLAAKAPIMLVCVLYSTLRGLLPKNKDEISEAEAAAAETKTRESQAIVDRLASKDYQSSAPATPATALSIGSFGESLDASK